MGFPLGPLIQTLGPDEAGVVCQVRTTQVGTATPPEGITPSVTGRQGNI